MSNYDVNEQPAKRTRTRLNLWDILSIIVVLITVCIAGYFALIFINPNTPLNPLPPPPTPFLFPTATITPIQLPATWTPTNPPFMTATDTPPATFTPIFTDTPFSLVPPTNTATPTATQTALFSATVTYASSTIMYPDLGCNFLGVGGTITDASGADIPQQVVALAGTFNGKSIFFPTVSGIVPSYGRSGFEFNLGSLLHLITVPVASTDTLYLQVLDQSGLPLSNNVYINTYTDCSKNLVLIRFKKRP